MKMNKIVKLTSAIALSACFSTPALAVLISGDIGLTGTLSVTGGTGPAGSGANFLSATGLNFISVQTDNQTNQTGDYAGIAAGIAVTHSNFNFNPFNGPISPLWSFSNGGVNYTFNLNSLDPISVHTENFLSLKGQGILSIAGGGTTFDPTPGSWVLSTNRVSNNLSLTFSAANSADNNIPEPLTLSLLGIGLAAFGAKRKASVTEI